MKRTEHAGVLKVYINFLLGWKNPDPSKDHSSGQVTSAEIIVGGQHKDSLNEIGVTLGMPGYSCEAINN